MRYCFFPVVIIFFLVIGGCAPGRGANPLQQRDIQARFDLASSYLLRGEPRLALMELKKVEVRCKNFPYFYFMKGMVYLALQNPVDAIVSFKKAVKLRPTYGEAWNNMGMAYVLLKRDEMARKCFLRALSIDSYLTPEYAAHNLSLLYERRGDYGHAILYEKKALVQNWRYLPSYLHLAHLYSKKGNYKDAISCLKRGIEAFPDEARIYYRLGENYLRINRQEDAKRAFERVVSLSKDPGLTRMARDYLALLK